MATPKALPPTGLNAAAVAASDTVIYATPGNSTALSRYVVGGGTSSQVNQFLEPPGISITGASALGAGLAGADADFTEYRWEFDEGSQIAGALVLPANFFHVEDGGNYLTFTDSLGINFTGNTYGRKSPFQLRLNNLPYIGFTQLLSIQISFYHDVDTQNTTGAGTFQTNPYILLWDWIIYGITGPDVLFDPDATNLENNVAEMRIDNNDSHRIKMRADGDFWQSNSNRMPQDQGWYTATWEIDRTRNRMRVQIRDGKKDWAQTGNVRFNSTNRSFNFSNFTSAQIGVGFGFSNQKGTQFNPTCVIAGIRITRTALLNG